MGRSCFGSLRYTSVHRVYGPTYWALCMLQMGLGWQQVAW